MLHLPCRLEFLLHLSVLRSGLQAEHFLQEVRRMGLQKASWWFTQLDAGERAEALSGAMLSASMAALQLSGSGSAAAGSEQGQEVRAVLTEQNRAGAHSALPASLGTATAGLQLSRSSSTGSGGPARRSRPIQVQGAGAALAGLEGAMAGLQLRAEPDRGTAGCLLPLGVQGSAGAQASNVEQLGKQADAALGEAAAILMGHQESGGSRHLQKQRPGSSRQPVGDATGAAAAAEVAGSEEAATQVLPASPAVPSRHSVAGLSSASAQSPAGKPVENSQQLTGTSGDAAEPRLADSDAQGSSGVTLGPSSTTAEPELETLDAQGGGQDISRIGSGLSSLVASFSAHHHQASCRARQGSVCLQPPAASNLAHPQRSSASRSSSASPSLSRSVSPSLAPEAGAAGGALSLSRSASPSLRPAGSASGLPLLGNGALQPAQKSPEVGRLPTQEPSALGRSQTGDECSAAVPGQQQYLKLAQVSAAIAAGQPAGSTLSAKPHSSQQAGSAAQSWERVPMVPLSPNTHAMGDRNPAQPSVVPAAGGSLVGMSCLDFSSLPVNWNGGLEQIPEREIAAERRWAWLQLCILLCWSHLHTAVCTKANSVIACRKQHSAAAISTTIGMPSSGRCLRVHTYRHLVAGSPGQGRRRWTEAETEQLRQGVAVSSQVQPATAGVLLLACLLVMLPCRRIHKRPKLCWPGVRLLSKPNLTA